MPAAVDPPDNGQLCDSEKDESPERFSCAKIVHGLSALRRGADQARVSASPVRAHVFHVETLRQKNPVELSIQTLTDKERKARVKIAGDKTSLYL